MKYTNHTFTSKRKEEERVIEFLLLHAFLHMNVLFPNIIVLHVYYRGFNDAINGFTDDGWSLMGSDGMDDIVIATNSTKKTGANASSNAFASAGGVICAKASMLLQVSTKLLSLLWSNFMLLMIDIKHDKFILRLTWLSEM